MYLDDRQLTSYLSLSKSVEQWLGVLSQDDYTIVRWVRIDREKNGNYNVSYFEVFDEGNVEFLDVYEFSAVDPDEPYGKIDTFSNYDEALSFSFDVYNCKNDKFVNAGLIQQEYKQYIESRP